MEALPLVFLKSQPLRRWMPWHTIHSSSDLTFNGMKFNQLDGSFSEASSNAITGLIFNFSVPHLSLSQICDFASRVLRCRVTEACLNLT